PPFVAPIGDESGPRTEQQDRPELRGRERAQRHAVVRELEDEQRLGDERQPVADLRDQLSREEEPEVSDPERPKGFVEGGADGGHTVNAIVMRSWAARRTEGSDRCWVPWADRAPARR